MQIQRNLCPLVDFLSGADKLAPVPDQPHDDNDTWVIFWSSGTTGVPKGIQYRYDYLRFVVNRFLIDGSRADCAIVTTCVFHLSGFGRGFTTLSKKYNIHFFAVEDLPDNQTADLLFKAIDKVQPPLMLTGSHHLVQLSKAPKPPADLKLDSLLMAMPIGSTVPLTVQEELKPKFPNMVIGNFYSMTEIGILLTMSLDVGFLGAVQKGIILKLVDPETGKLCGQNEVCTII